MSHTHLAFDPPTALARTSELLQRIADNAHLHQRQAPQFPPGAAGAGLRDRGEALARLFTQLHTDTAVALDAVRLSTHTASDHLRALSESDRDVAGALSRINAGGEPR
ncbi:hypothetical protein CCICO_01855 [Corynebacterium ciconiae DSM 44920]|uniref:hypothetical protein n=1 Tax=Corynebacterium ciconiae TaxID=227319 RepID=UPI000374681D|nr:hypothetical protein [Corynebacterium ciconiae]WKD60423.1 hypothetical protein CCICO_01855 [Corynebacterium ciconiae DSM 44920]